ncbi:porin family protein [uncultured Bacteroides sp.]|uniref:porin family protein n=1 Tax=uncultured Bacteroides sp. TaxID=162156 RepID=UPI002AA8C7F2|nr:porin family protein [uncultured Bacteroides sp.]
MKRFTSALMLAVCLAMAMPAQAQIKLGVKGGLNLASASLSDAWKEKSNSDNYTGFFVGPMIDITVPFVGIGVDGALMYSQKGTKFSFDNGGVSMDKTFKQQGIEIPINLKYSIGLGSMLGIYFAAGPSFFFNMKSDDKVTLDNAVAAIDYEKSEVALNLGMGVKLVKHLQIGVNYNMPLTDSAKASVDSGSYASLDGKSFKTKVWQVSVAYLF